jgi:hypothetical protein
MPLPALSGVLPYRYVHGMVTDSHFYVIKPVYPATIIPPFYLSPLKIVRIINHVQIVNGVKVYVKAVSKMA